MRRTHDLDKELIEELVKITKARTKREAINMAMSEVIRQKNERD